MNEEKLRTAAANDFESSHKAEGGIERDGGGNGEEDRKPAGEFVPQKKERETGQDGAMADGAKIIPEKRGRKKKNGGSARKNC